MNLSNNHTKYIRSLGMSKFRQKYENFVAEGDKTCGELLNSDFSIECVVAMPSWLENNGHALKNPTYPVYTANQEQMDQISSLQHPSEVVVVAKQKWGILSNILALSKPVYFLDGVQDPGNVGTIIRIADWFGFGGVLLGPGTADGYHPKVVQATMGSVAGIPMVKTDRQTLMALIETHQICLLDMGGDVLSLKTKLPFQVYVLGAEGKGIDAAWKQTNPELACLSIDGSGLKVAESLNVGVAAGIVGHHVFNYNLQLSK